MTLDAPADISVHFNSTAPRGPEQRAAADSSNVLTIIGSATSQVVLITALFYYFGWVYAHSFLGYFGVDPSLVGYSTADYVLRSINVAFRPLIYTTFAALIMFGFHRLVIAPALIDTESDPPPPSNIDTSNGSSPATPQVVTRLRLSRTLGPVVSWAQGSRLRRPGPPSIGRFMGGLQTIAIIFASAALTGVIFPTQVGASLGLLLPLLLIISVILLGYITHLRSRHPDALTVTSSAQPTLPSRAYALTLLSLGLIAGLWAVSLYGDFVGIRVAMDISTQLSDSSEVVIYSTERIALQGPGIVVDDITQPGTKYHYKYTGLRLLTRSSDRFLLLPSEWQHGRDHVFLLRDNDSIRVDLIAAT